MADLNVVLPTTTDLLASDASKVTEVAPVQVVNLVPAAVDLLTSTDLQVADLTPAPVVNVDSNAVDTNPIVSLLTSTDTKVAEVTEVAEVPVINVDNSVEVSALTDVVNTAILNTDNVGPLGITDLSLIAASGTPVVLDPTPVLVAPPVLATLPTVLDVVKLDTTAIGSKFQNLAQGNTIDLSDYTGIAFKADITTQGDAAYTNNIGFYIVEDAIGTIKLADGTSIKPGDANYAVEAIKNALTNSLQAGKIDSNSGQDITGGRIYAPVVVAQGSLTDFVSNNPTNGGGANDIHAYFNYIGANSDNTNHFKLLSNNTFGVEDMYGGGDRDFNDLVVTMNIKPV
jgi:Domain of unknown function (DUF4114)